VRKIIVFLVLVLLLGSLTSAIQLLDIGSLADKLKEIRKANLELMEAKYWTSLEGLPAGRQGKTVQCQLCPNFCVLQNGKKGRCGSRINVEGKLYTMVYARPVAVHIDPIEKKPFTHFLPRTQSFSIATAGCNLGCIFCQNWQISQSRPEDAQSMILSPADVVRSAKENKCATIAYTYTEPTIFYEYMLDTAKLAEIAGVRNVMHTCGYINPKPLKELLKYMDAVNVDLKGFSEEYYVQMCSGQLDPVLETIRTVKKSGVWLEITNLVIPGKNDDPKMIRAMCVWIKKNVGADTPVYFSAFTPQYKLTSLPPTPVKTLEDAAKIAKSAGLRYVYIGNVYGHAGESTYCPHCGKLIVKRMGFDTLEIDLVDGKCKYCGYKIAGVWE
jgi:pyruvate formate lyase activating enzyme